jgi:OmcA/MtrC family decaheme c-type cytochrome
VLSKFQMLISEYRSVAFRYGLILAVVAGAAVLSSAERNHNGLTPRQKAFYANDSTINFVRPGLTITIVTAKIDASGTATVDFKITDPKGLGLDRLGVTTPGAVSTSFLIGSIPKGQTQFNSYATRSRASTDGKTSVIQATSDSGGTYQQVGDGEYIYIYGTKIPTATFDGTATHRVGIYGNRNLTEFDMGTNYADTTFTWIPAGGKPAPRDVIRTASCNKCHDQLAFHGGSRRSMELCIMCHTPQLPDPNSGTADFKVMIHKIHAGSTLPSVKAGGTYNIGSSDWSTVQFPSDVRRCQSCHESTTGATQANAWFANPNRAACGSCHDDVNFATGQNHVNLPQVDDKQCSTCHIEKGELEFDASIKGAHTIPQESATRPGLVVTLVKVDGAAPGSKPTVTYQLKDSAGNPINANSLTTSPNKVSLVLAGPTTDYGYTSFGSDVTSPGYVSEAAAAASKCGNDGTCTYTFTHAIPANAKGTFAVGVEARRSLTILPGTVKQSSTQYGADNKVLYFSVDGSPVAKRRQVVDIAKCNQCHTRLSMHGENRNNTEYCVFCHNPSNTASSGVGINLSVMVHSIHFGENLAAAGATYKIGSSDFSEVRYPAMSNNGHVGDTTNCSMCHVNGSEAVFPIGKNAVKDPGALMDPAPATTAACAACHVTRSNMAHMSTQTDPKFGESCDACHAAGAQFDVTKMHAQ